MFVVSAKLGHTPSYTSSGCASVVEMWQVITLQGPLHVYGLLVHAQERGTPSGNALLSCGGDLGIVDTVGFGSLDETLCS